MKISTVHTLAIASALFALGACKPGSQISSKVTKLPTVEVSAAQLDSIKALQTAQKPYNAAARKINDLLHTKLEVSFDWAKQHLLGKATLRFKPEFYPTDSLRLDAKGFDIKKVSLLKNGQETPLSYVYNDTFNLYIRLDRVYTRKEEYTIFIEYVAKPNELKEQGSNAITSDKGLYFINPLGKEPNKPRQIWTQGETEASSKWFPTIDRPNERCTQEIYMTVENKYRTLSNGVLKSSTPNADGTRTDYWVMDLPHAPYLFMMTVGEFATVKDSWNGMLLEYIVEPAYEAHAKNIYPHTPEMLTFFSDKFGIKYPWQKYSQVVVRDYVSGAMENTTAVIFGDFVQLTSREIVDNPELNEGIVAHEMMHHWFGDLVTCESWANLPLNESFANYSEYLWAEYKHGKDAADYHRMNEVNGYFSQSVMQNDNHPMIYFEYRDKEDMFDSHSYNKGGAILHMLRKFLGDDAYFEGLKYYFETHKYTSVEIHDLRLAFEKVSGQDLNWFFNQWFFKPGHPKLDIQRVYNDTTKLLTVTVKQTQDTEKFPIFRLPIDIDIYTNEFNSPDRFSVVLDKAEHTFKYPLNKAPIWVAVDAERNTLCERSEKQTPEQWAVQYKLGKNFHNRYYALNELKKWQTKSPIAKETLLSALDDKFWNIRQSAIDGLSPDFALDEKIAQKLQTLAQNDPRPHVRGAAVDKLGTVKHKPSLPILEQIMGKDTSFLVMGATLDAIAEIDKLKALEYAQKLEKENKNSILVAVARLYGKTSDRKYIDFYEKNWERTTNYNTVVFFDNYLNLLKNVNDPALMLSKLEFFKKIALDNNQAYAHWSRYAAGSALKKMREMFREDKKANASYTLANDAINEIKAKEKHPMLVKIYQKW
jgi:aminopeptidase N